MHGSSAIFHDEPFMADAVQEQHHCAKRRRCRRKQEARPPPRCSSRLYLYVTGVTRACRRTIKSDCFYPGASPSRWPLLTPRVWRASWESRSTPWIAVCEDRRHRVIGLDQFGHLTYRLLCIPPQGTVSAGDKPATLFCWHESVHFPRRLEAVSGREDCI